MRTKIEMSRKDIRKEYEMRNQLKKETSRVKAIADSQPAKGKR